MVVVTVNSVSYYMNPKLKNLWDSLKEGKLENKDEDRVYIVDGRERSGKSVFALQQAAYIDPTLTVDRICFTPEEFVNAIKNGKPGQVIVFDEAFRGLSSSSSRSKINLMIKRALMEMGQRNLVIFIVLPSFFLLDIYAAMLRSNALFHIYRDSKNRRGQFRVYNYNKKNALYQIGLKRGWSYSNPKTKFRDRFFNKYPIDQEAYRAKKAQSLHTVDSLEAEEKDSKYLNQRDILLNYLYQQHFDSLSKLSAMLSTLNISLTKQALSLICAKVAKTSTDKGQI